jgi:hypothetical protein
MSELDPLAVDEKLAMRRASNRRAAAILRQKKNKGYTPASNGMPGRPKKKGTWNEESKLFVPPEHQNTD